MLEIIQIDQKIDNQIDNIINNNSVIEIPSSPKIINIIPGTGQLTVFFEQPSLGGKFDNYEYSPNGGMGWTARTPASINSPLIIGNLAQVTGHLVTIRAVNAAGVGRKSSIVPATSFAVPVTPQPTIAPLILVANPGDQQVLIVAIDQNPIGAKFTNLEYSLDNGVTWITNNPAVIDSFTITGLTNGVTYQIKVRGTNAGGTSPASQTTNVTPASVPSAPTITSITPGQDQLTVAFTAPSDGGNPIDRYSYSLDNGVNWVTPAFPFVTSSPIIITNLTIGTTYQVRVRAGNSIGFGPGSNMVTGTPIPGAPTAPTITSITPNNGTLSVAFTAPSSDGGTSITNYEYSTNNGSTWTARSPSATNSPLIISGLTNGTTYQVRIRAINSAGAGTASSAVNGTPILIEAPSAPTITSITPSDGQLSVAFTAPSSNGGATITNYEYSTNNGSTWTARSPASATSPLVISGLTNTTSYQVRIRAVNSAGAGTQSNAVSGTPIGAPSEPTITGITPSNGTLSVAFTAPASNGGATITNYEYSTNDGSTWTARSPADITSPLVITGLVNGTSYQVRIRAINSLGTSAPSSAVSGTPSGTSITLTVNSNGSLFENYTTNTVTVSGGGYGDPSGFNPEFVGGSTVTSLTFSSCGYYGFVINETSTLTNLTNLSFDGCGNYSFSINDTDFFKNLTSIYFGSYLGSEGAGGQFNIIDNTTVLPEAKALLVLNAILNAAQNRIIGRGTITLKVTGSSTLQTVRNNLISEGFTVNLVT